MLCTECGRKGTTKYTGVEVKTIYLPSLFRPSLSFPRSLCLDFFRDKGGAVSFPVQRPSRYFCSHVIPFLLLGVLHERKIIPVSFTSPTLEVTTTCGRCQKASKLPTEPPGRPAICYDLVYIHTYATVFLVQHYCETRDPSSTDVGGSVSL